MSRRRAFPRALGRLTVGSLLAAGALACAGEPPPWDVRPGQEGRFRESRKACRILTDVDGALHEERFEACMKRRGWKRMGPIRRLLAD